jgi:hypothetical protein
VLKASKVPQELKVLLVIPGLKVYRAFRVLLVRKACKAQLVLKAR